MKEVEISFKGLFFYVLKHWKSISFAMLLGVVALGGLQMIRSSRAVQSVQTTENAGIDLTDSERGYVEAVGDYLNGLRFAIKTRKESLIMNLDPQNLIKTELIYVISVEEPNSLEGVEKTYETFLTSSEFIGFVSDKTGISTSDISETVVVNFKHNREESTNTSAYIVIFSDEKSVSEAIANAVDSYISEKSSHLSQKGYVHSIVKVGNNTYQGIDNNVQTLQLQYLQEIQLRTQAICNSESALTSAQKTYYESLVNDSNEDEEDSIIENHSIVSGRLSAKYIIVGLFLGAFLMCGLHIFIYIFSNRLDEDDNVENIFDTYLIGVVAGKESKKISAKLRHLGKRTFDYEESVRLVSTKIKMSAKKEGISKIGIVGCGIKKNNNKTANDIVIALKNDGIEATIIDEPLYDPSSAEELARVDRVVLLEKAGITFRTEIWKEIEMIKKLDIDIDGIIIAE